MGDPPAHRPHRLIRMKREPPLIELDDEQELVGCPYCKEEILAAAQKCKHCGEFLPRSSPWRNRFKSWAPALAMSVAFTVILVGVIVYLGPKLSLPKHVEAREYQRRQVAWGAEIDSTLLLLLGVADDVGRGRFIDAKESCADAGAEFARIRREMDQVIPPEPMAEGHRRVYLLLAKAGPALEACRRGDFLKFVDLLNAIRSHE
jgi:hypothetical protein